MADNTMPKGRFCPFAVPSRRLPGGTKHTRRISETRLGRQIDRPQTTRAIYLTACACLWWGLSPGRSVTCDITTEKEAPFLFSKMHSVRDQFRDPDYNQTLPYLNTVPRIRDMGTGLTFTGSVFVTHRRCKQVESAL